MTSNYNNLYSTSSWEGVGWDPRRAGGAPPGLVTWLVLFECFQIHSQTTMVEIWLIFMDKSRVQGLKNKLCDFPLKKQW